MEKEKNPTECYYSYSIENDGSLHSSDPESLAYLILNALVHEDFSNAKKYVDILEDLGKRIPYSAKTHFLLDSLTIPLLIEQNDTCMEIALRLSSIRSENSLLQTPPVSQLFYTDKLEYFLILTKYNQYLKSQQEGKKQILSEIQELFLLRRLEEKNESFLQLATQNIDVRIRTWISSLGVDVFASHIFLPPKIFERQQMLRSKYKDGNGAMRITETILFETVTNAGSTQNPLTSLVAQGQSPPSILSKIIRTFGKYVQNPFRSPIDNELRRVSPCDYKEIETLPVDLWDLSLNTILKYFPLYYRLAANTLPVEWKGDSEKEHIFSEKASRLRTNLELLRGHYTGFSGSCLLILHKMAQKSHLVSFPHPDVLDDLLLKRNQFSVLNREYKILFSTNANMQTEQETAAALAKRKHELEKQLKELLRPFHIYHISGNTFDLDFDLAPFNRAIDQFFCDCQNACRKTEACSMFFSKECVTFLTSKVMSLGVFAVKRAALSALGLAPLYYGYKGVSLTFNVVRSLVKTNSISSLPSTEVFLRVEELPSLSFPLCENLKGRENQVNALFRSLFDAYFTETTISQEKTLPPSLAETDDSSLSLQTTLEKIKQSLVDYHNRPQELTKQIILREGKTQENLLKEIKQLQQEFQGRVVKEQAAIVKLASFPKKKQQSEATLFLNSLTANQKKEEKPSFEELFSAFARGELDALVEKGRIPAEHKVLIEEKMYLLLTLTSRFQFLFSQVAAAKSSSDIGEALIKMRVYEFTGPELFVRSKLLFEASMQVLLWKRPMEQLEKMLKSQNQKAVLEALMGWGKSFCLIPLASAIETNKSQIIFTIWPSSVATTTIQDIGTQMKKAFAKTANAIRCSRSFLPDVWALTQLFTRALHQGEQINATQEDLKSLELQFLEKGLCSLEPQKATKEGLNQFDLLRHILAKVRTQGKGIIDEVHKLFDPQKNELNHPLGRKKILPREYVHLMSKVLHLLVSLPEVNDIVHIKAESPSPVNEAVFVERVVPVLLEHISQFPELAIPEEHRQDFIEYALGRRKAIPSFILGSKKKESLGLIKGLMNPLIPMVLKKIANVDYAQPKDPKDGDFARPSEGNENPEESSTIRNPFEAFLKSGILVLQKRLSDHQIKALISLFKRRAEQEAIRKNSSQFDTSFAKLFEQLSLGRGLFSVDENKLEDDLLDLLKKNDQFTLLYTEWVSSQRIEFFSQNLQSNPFNFASMFSSFYSFTGTPNNDGCFPDETVFHLDHGTLGESVDLLLSRCPDSSIHALQSKKPCELLQEVLASFFHEGSKTSALIDQVEQQMEQQQNVLGGCPDSSSPPPFLEWPKSLSVSSPSEWIRSSLVPPASSFVDMSNPSSSYTNYENTNLNQWNYPSYTQEATAPPMDEFVTSTFSLPSPTSNTENETHTVKNICLGACCGACAIGGAVVAVGCVVAMIAMEALLQIGLHEFANGHGG